MGLFSFLTESGRGCFAVLAKDRLIYEVTLWFFMVVLLSLHFCEYEFATVLFLVSDDNWYVNSISSE